MNLIEEIPNRMAENAAFFWLLHDQALNSPDYDLAELEELESRIDAQLDGLLAYGEEGWKACEEALQFEEPGEIFTAAAIAFTHGSSEQVKQVVELACQSDENYQALISALVWLPFESAKRWIGKLMHAENPAYATIGICVCALHHANCGDALNKAIANPAMQSSVEYFSQVMRAAGVMNRRDVHDDLVVYQKDSDPSLALASVYYACLLGDKSNVSLLVPLFTADIDFAEKSLDLLFRALPLPEAKSLLSEMSKREDMQRVLIKALGVLGDPHSLAWLVEQMENESVARLAAESFSKIVGINIDAEGFSVAQLEEDLDDRPDSHLPLPDKSKIECWLKDNAQRFTPGHRYLAGEHLTEAHCQALMKDGAQNQRRDAYQELIINFPNSGLDENRRRLRI